MVIIFIKLEIKMRKILNENIEIKNMEIKNCI